MKSTQVKLNGEEIKTFLSHIINTNKEIQAEGKVPIAVEIQGPAGLGKTSIAEQVAEEQGLKLVKLNLSMIDELGDLIGYPRKEYELKKDSGETREVIKKRPDGQLVKIKQKVFNATWVDENIIEQYTAQGYQFTGNTRMGYAIPEWIQGHEDGNILLLLDDYSRASLTFLQATMELVQNQEYISWKLPKNSHILLTSNPEEGDYIINTSDSAMRTRYMTIHMKWDVDTWAKWAEENGIRDTAINFMLAHPEIVTDEINPRALTTFFNSISSFKDFNANPETLIMIQMLAEASVGPEVATMFTTFVNNKLDRIISPKQMLLTVDNNVVKKELQDSIGLGDNARADIASILVTRFINFTTIYANTNPITPAHIDRIKFLATSDIFQLDLVYHMVKKIVNADKTKFAKALLDPTLQEILLK